MSIYAIDFDGTICESRWPEIGQEIPGVIEQLKHLDTEANS